MASLRAILVLVRADRLVAILMLLQRRHQVTATEVAEELEVSVRTARRDLEALSAAGIPVYSQQGRGGGWRLLGGARTDLSGLNESEARVLFLVAGPAVSATPQLKSALSKLVHTLPSRSAIRPRPPPRPSWSTPIDGASPRGVASRTTSKLCRRQ